MKIKKSKDKIEIKFLYKDIDKVKEEVMNHVSLFDLNTNDCLMAIDNHMAAAKIKSIFFDYLHDNRLITAITNNSKKSVRPLLYLDDFDSKSHRDISLYVYMSGREAFRPSNTGVFRTECSKMETYFCDVERMISPAKFEDNNFDQIIVFQSSGIRKIRNRFFYYKKNCKFLFLNYLISGLESDGSLIRLESRFPKLFERYQKHHREGRRKEEFFIKDFMLEGVPYLY